nr:pyridoxal phosphate-dependent aminotransferase [uncultured Pseudomonas sp.]
MTETQPKFLNKHLASAQSSATYAMINRVEELRSQGKTIISLSTGEPDFDTPAAISNAAIDAINAGLTRYTAVAGMKALREAVASKFRVENQLDVGWENTIVCNGGKHVIFNALACTLNEGDEVIIPAPYWVSYPEMVCLAGATPIIVPCTHSTGFKLTPQLLRAAITPATKWLILNSPSNPTGAVYSKDELEALAETLLDYPGILILSDDIYEHLIFDDMKFFTLAQIEPRLQARVLTMNGVSKAYAMTGWRIGFATGPKWLIEAMEKLQSQQTSGACTISQYAALAALEGPKDCVVRSRCLFERRRDLMVRLLNTAPGLACSSPAGAFYAFVNCEGLLGKMTPGGRCLKTDEDVAYALLEEAHVAVVHGGAFGMSPFIRIAYALDEALLKQCCIAIANFCTSLK